MSVGASPRKDFPDASCLGWEGQAESCSFSDGQLSSWKRESPVLSRKRPGRGSVSMSMGEVLTRLRSQGWTLGDS